jgi:glucosamine kinase
VELDGASRQEGDVIAAVARAVASGWQALGSPPAVRAVLGLTTAPSDPAAGARLCQLVAGATGAAEVWLADDAITAGFGALSGQPGVSITVGTGVACLAVAKEAAPRVIGGHGYLLGDEGGGFWIGRRGLGAALRAAENRGPATALTAMARSRFGDLDGAHARLHDADRPVHAIAQFASDVMEAASNADQVAGAILDEAARELLSVVEAGLVAVGGDSLDVALGGRLLRPGTELRRRMDALLAARLPSVRSRDADGSGLDGALALGALPEPGRYASFIHVWTSASGNASTSVSPGARASAGHRYLEMAAGGIARLADPEWLNIRAGAELVADAIEGGGHVHAFGSGHSHMLAEEIFYRAGGLARVRPILYGPLMLHEDAARSTELERRLELADEILAGHPMEPGDVLIVASNSGGNAVAVRLAERARERAVHVIAITSLKHATSSAARSNDLPRIHELADVVIDNGGVVGDATVDIPGFDRRVGPTSTVVGAAILNAMVAEAVQILVERGTPVDVYASSNVAGGDEINAPLLPDPAQARAVR